MADDKLELLEIQRREHLEEGDVQGRKSLGYGYDLVNGKWRRVAVNADGHLIIEAVLDASEINIGDVNILDSSDVKINPATEETLTDIANHTDIQKYALCEIDDTDSTYTYFGKEDKDGNWFIKRMTNSSNSTVYAVGTGGIASVWSNRASQSYGAFNTKF